LEKKLSNNFKNGHENFSGVRVSIVFGLWKFFMSIFEFVGQFFFENDVFKLKQDFSEHVIRVFLGNGL
jgi:hypothetical protein